MVNFSTSRSDGPENVFGEPVGKFRRTEEDSPELKARRNTRDMEIEQVTEIGLKALDLLDQMKRMADIDNVPLVRDGNGQWISNTPDAAVADVEWMVLDIDFDKLRELPLDGEAKPELEFSGHRTQQGALAHAITSHIDGLGVPQFKEWEKNGIRVFFKGNHKVVVLPKDDELIDTVIGEMGLQRYFDLSGYKIDKT